MQPYYQYRDGRFVVPFLVGALAGGAAVGVSRPRPVVVTGGGMPGVMPPRPYPPISMPYFY